MEVIVEEFEGWATTKTMVRRHTVSDFMIGIRVFDMEAIRALNTNMDAYAVRFVVEGNTEREIIFHDRKAAREG